MKHKQFKSNTLPSFSTDLLMKNYTKILIASTFFTLLTGCFNTATPSSQITAAYSSSVKYEGYDCKQLRVELDSLSQRESQLVVAQDERRSSSKVQAFWLGYGNGDGVEASELAQVRGEIVAVRKMIALKGCQ